MTDQSAISFEEPLLIFKWATLYSIICLGKLRHRQELFQAVDESHAFIVPRFNPAAQEHVPIPNVQQSLIHEGMFDLIDRFDGTTNLFLLKSVDDPAMYAEVDFHTGERLKVETELRGLRPHPVIGLRKSVSISVCEDSART